MNVGLGVGWVVVFKNVSSVLICKTMKVLCHGFPPNVGVYRQQKFIVKLMS